MVEYGTQVVAGVTPGKGGQQVHNVPVFDSVAAAVSETGANASVIYVPARFCADAIFEAADAGSTNDATPSDITPPMRNRRPTCRPRPVHSPACRFISNTLLSSWTGSHAVVRRAGIAMPRTGAESPRPHSSLNR